jgi:hypothetical protein
MLERFKPHLSVLEPILSHDQLLSLDQQVELGMTHVLKAMVDNLNDDKTVDVRVVVFWLTVIGGGLVWAVLQSFGTARMMWVAALVLYIIGVLCEFPRYHVAQFNDIDPDKRFDKENESRKTLAQIFGGTAVLIGLWSASEQLTGFVKPATEIQAIMTIIGRRNHTFKHGETARLDLNEVNLRGIVLFKAHLEGAMLNHTILDSSTLLDTHLEEAFMEGASLRNTNFDQAFLNNSILMGSDFTSANLRRTRLDGAMLASDPKSVGSLHTVPVKDISGLMHTMEVC